MRFNKIIMGVALSLVLSIGYAEAKCNDQKALALSMYHEARGEGIDGKLMVAEVIINRTHSDDFPKTICGVVFEDNQFEFVDKKLKVKDKETFDEIMDLSAEIISGDVDLPGTDALYFKTKGYNSKFHKKRVFIGTYGGHDFFK